MRLTVIIVISALGTVSKILKENLVELEIRGRIGTLQITALLRPARIFRRVQEIWGDLLSLKLQWKNHQLTLVWKTLNTTTTSRVVDFAVLADCRINLKESEKKDKYQELDRDLKKVWNMKVTIIPIVNGALGTVTKGLIQRLKDLEIRRRKETIQTTALLKSARILRRVLETWGDFAVTQILTLVWKTLKGVIIIG